MGYFLTSKSVTSSQATSSTQQLKMTAVKAWQSISVEETQHSVMSMSCGLQSPASQDFHPSFQTTPKLRYMLVCQITVGPNPLKIKIKFLSCRNNPNRFFKSHQCHFQTLFYFSPLYIMPQSHRTHTKKEWKHESMRGFIHLFICIS